MYQTLKKQPDGSYVGECPACPSVTLVDAGLRVVPKCRHFVRSWRVTADQRVRAEYRVNAAPAAGSHG